MNIKKLVYVQENELHISNGHKSPIVTNIMLNNATF